MKLYTYKNCDTCRKAVKWLKEKNIEFVEVPIREQPPTKVELNRMLTIYRGDLRKLFNTSGQDYKALGMKDKIVSLTNEEAVGLLSGNGNLVKRPFLLTRDAGAVGFNIDEWKKLLNV